MRYLFEGVEYKLEFQHGQTLHPRLVKPRQFTALHIIGPSNAVHLSATVIFNPKGKERTWSKELMRQAAIEKLGEQVGILVGEYQLIRQAYFLRRRKTKAQKLQTRMFNREVKKILADGDINDAVRRDLQSIITYLRDRHAKTEANQKSPAAISHPV